jgi:hypothetical protein
MAASLTTRPIMGVPSAVTLITCARTAKPSPERRVRVAMQTGKSFISLIKTPQLQMSKGKKRKSH